MHKITLSNVAVALLRSCLESVGWANTPRLIVSAAGVLDKLAPVTIPAGLETLRTQRDAVASPLFIRDEWAFDFSETERETVKTAVRSACEKGYLTPGPITVELFAAFGIE